MRWAARRVSGVIIALIIAILMHRKASGEICGPNTYISVQSRYSYVNCSPEIN
jgi:hypothetical protein